MVGGVCANRDDCPHGFVYWTSLHGPFFQTSPAGTDITNSGYLGAFVRVYADANGYWQVKKHLNVGSLAQGQASPGQPGGDYEAIAYHRISSIPRPQKCSISLVTTADDGSHAYSASRTGPTSNLSILGSLIGNVSRGQNDYLKPTIHMSTRPSPFGPISFPDGLDLSQHHTTGTGLANWFSSEAWVSSCPSLDLTGSWDASQQFAATEVESLGDVKLMGETNADKNICFLSGIKGDWSQTWPIGTTGASTQTYAQIYRKTGDGWWLKAYPNPTEAARLGGTPVGAYGTCLPIDLLSTPMDERTP